jgi:hypothetical protein
LNSNGYDDGFDRMFFDIKNFTSIAEFMEPEVLVNILGQYFEEMTTIIVNHGGLIDKCKFQSATLNLCLRVCEWHLTHSSLFSLLSVHVC